MKKYLWIILAVVFIAVLAGAYVLYTRLAEQNPAQQVQQTQGQTDEEDTSEEPQTVAAPDFTVTDADGNEVKLSDFAGKPVVLNFWATWCGPCKSEMPDFEKIFGEYGGQVQFMMINLTDGSRETVAGAQEYITQQGYTFPVYFDQQREAAITYGISAVPTTYFIDAEGNLVAGARGALSYEGLLDGISRILPNA